MSNLNIDMPQMEVDKEEALIESSSIEDIPSCSSSILDADGDVFVDDDDFNDGINVTILSMTDNISPKKLPIVDSGTNSTNQLTKLGSVSGNGKNPKLSGAARKRYKRMVSDGMVPAEAYRFAQTPMATPNSDPEKKSRYAEISGSISSGSNPRPSKMHCPLSETKPESSRQNATRVSVQNRLQMYQKDRSGRDETTQRNPNPLYSEVLNSVKVGIVPKDYPNVELSTQQLQLTRKAILTKVAQQRKEKVKPKFGHCSFRTGYLVLVCKNQETADWLKNIVCTITVLGGIELIALDEKNIPRPETIIGFFPVSV